MMYNMSMLRHRFSNEREGALNHLPLLFCKSVYIGGLIQTRYVFSINKKFTDCIDQNLC